MDKCEGKDCKICDEEHQSDIDNCPCNKNCPGIKKVLKIDKFPFQPVAPVRTLTVISSMNLPILAKILRIMKIISFVTKGIETYYLNASTIVKFLNVMLSATKRSTKMFKNALVLRNVLVSEKMLFLFLNLYFMSIEE